MSQKKKTTAQSKRPRKAPSNQTGGTAWGKKAAAAISGKMQSADVKKLILLNFPYIIAFYMVEKAAWLYRHCNGDTIVDRLMVLFMNFGLAYKSYLPTLGKETIDLYNTSDTRGNSPSFGTNYQKTGKELMSRDELAVMDGSKCILQLRGVRPFLSDKFDITKHKRYKELSDFDKKNEFDVERYLKHELRLLTTEEFDLYEVDVTEQAQG